MTTQTTTTEPVTSTVWSRVTNLVTAARRQRRVYGPGYLEAGVIARAHGRL